MREYMDGSTQVSSYWRHSHSPECEFPSRKEFTSWYIYIPESQAIFFWKLFKKQVYLLRIIQNISLIHSNPKQFLGDTMYTYFWSIPQLIYFPRFIIIHGILLRVLKNTHHI